ncbi:MAG: M28 family peptidase [Bacteroidetes bacterium]|nr:MAG: M28 family peptidase [Bacteroidota bacterium]
MRHCFFSRSAVSIASVLAITCLLGFSVEETSAQSTPSGSTIDADALLRHIRILSSDEYDGRRAGTLGGKKARDYVAASLQSSGIAACAGDLVQEFQIPGRKSELPTANVVGLIPGTGKNRSVIVLSAHYDHLGNRNGSIFNGADDNASGTAALLELAAWFQKNPLENDLVVAAFDAEESGLRGSRAFVDEPCVDKSRIMLNVNMDMISRSESSELYASGTHYYPAMQPILESAAAGLPISLLFGHDEPGTGSEDWTRASDQGPFFDADIPHIYFGVEDHPGYHNPTDEFEAITSEFYVSVVEYIAKTLVALDENSELIKRLEK